MVFYYSTSSNGNDILILYLEFNGWPASLHLPLIKCSRQNLDFSAPWQIISEIFGNKKKSRKVGVHGRKNKKQRQFKDHIREKH